MRNGAVWPAASGSTAPVRCWACGALCAVVQGCALQGSMVGRHGRHEERWRGPNSRNSALAHPPGPLPAPAPARHSLQTPTLASPPRHPSICHLDGPRFTPKPIVARTVEDIMKVRHPAVRHPTVPSRSQPTIYPTLAPGRIATIKGRRQRTRLVYTYPTSPLGPAVPATRDRSNGTVARPALAG